MNTLKTFCRAFLRCFCIHHNVCKWKAHGCPPQFTFGTLDTVNYVELHISYIEGYVLKSEIYQTWTGCMRLYSIVTGNIPCTFHSENIFWNSRRIQSALLYQFTIPLLLELVYQSLPEDCEETAKVTNTLLQPYVPKTIHTEKLSDLIYVCPDLFVPPRWPCG